MLVDRLSSLLLAVALVSQPGVALAQNAPPTPVVEFGTRKLNLPLGETTEVHGKIPGDLTGVWLVSENHGLPGGKTFPALQLYRIELDQDKLRINWLEWKPSAALEAKLAQAQAAQQSWTPSQEDLQALKAEVAKNPPPIDPKRRARHVVTAASAYPPEIKAAKESAGSILAIQSLFQPSGRPPYGESYYIKTASSGELSGALTLGALPQDAAGVPLPVGTSGAARWIRVGAATAAVVTPPAK